MGETPERQIEELRAEIAAMRRDLARRHDTVEAILVALFAQYGDPTHVDVERAAQLCDCSVKTIRRRIDAGELTLEVIPGTRRTGIPIEQIHSRWISIGAARTALQRELAGGRGGTVKRNAKRKGHGSTS